MQWDEVRKNDTYVLMNNPLNIVIHKSYGSDSWHLTCKSLYIREEELNTDVFNEAVKRAQVLIMEKSNELYEAAVGFVKNIYDKNEFLPR